MSVGAFEVTFNLGTNTFPAVEPGAVMRVGDIWKEQGMYTIAIVHNKGRAEEFDLSAVFAAGGKHYAVVRPHDILGEGKLWPPVVMEVVSADQVKSLNFESFDQVRTDAQNAFGQGPDDKIINKAFGSVANVDDDEEEMNLRRDLTHELYLGGHDPTKDAENIGISSLLNAHGSVTATLFRQFDPETYEFRFHATMELNGERYVILLYPTEMTADEDTLPMVVLKVLDAKELQTMHFSNLMSVRRDVIEWLRSHGRVTAAEFEKVFGPIEQFPSGA